jgi:hypothetical protein
MITVLVLKSCTLMPEFRVLEEGQTVTLPAETAAWVISGGIGRVVPSGAVEIADAPAPHETAVTPAQRGAKGRRG